MKNKRGLTRFTGIMLSVCLAFVCAGTAWAGTYDIGQGSVTVHATETDQTVQHGDSQAVSDSDPVITGTSLTNTVTIQADTGAEAKVTFSGLDADVSTKQDTAAVKTTGGGNVRIELDGQNEIESGFNCAGIQKENDGRLTITDSNGTAGSLDTEGGVFGAGIGGGNEKNGSGIVIEGGEITAKGGHDAAGIGGGNVGDGTDITISGGEVTATGGYNAAGIGGGQDKDGKDITISGGEVTAKGGTYGAGIGGGVEGDGSGILISDGEVNATGGHDAAGIGGGNLGEGKDITVEDGKVSATGGYNAAGIGGGQDKDGKDITISGGEVTAKGGTFGAGIGGGTDGDGSGILISGGEVNAVGGHDAAGIGGGNVGDGTDITISGGEVTAIGGWNAAGIGGGQDKDGKDITVSGGEVTAEGGTFGAGIGGGVEGEGSGIKVTGGTVKAAGGRSAAGIGGGNKGAGKKATISGTAYVSAAGGGEYASGEDRRSKGAAIGNGGADGQDGQEIDPDTGDLLHAGTVELYAAGTDTDEMGIPGSRPEKTIHGTKHTPGPAVKENETSNGYDEVVYCTECGEEISRKSVRTGGQPAGAVTLLTVTDVTGTAQLSFLSDGTFEISFGGSAEKGTFSLKDGQVVLVNDGDPQGTEMPVVLNGEKGVYELTFVSAADPGQAFVFEMTEEEQQKLTASLA